MREHVADDDGFILVVDQLEELFTLTARPEDRARFEALLAEALGDLDGPLHLITTVRSDFMARFAELERLARLLKESAGRYPLLPIGEAGLKDVVHTPARLAGLHWSEASLPTTSWPKRRPSRAPCLWSATCSACSGTSATATS